MQKSSCSRDTYFSCSNGRRMDCTYPMAKVALDDDDEEEKVGRTKNINNNKGEGMARQCFSPVTQNVCE